MPKKLPAIDSQHLLQFLTGLLNTPSPTGRTAQAIEYVEDALQGLPGVRFQRTRKGALLVTLPGVGEDAPRALTAHVDTLGAMVKQIKSSGRLELSMLGGYSWNTVEGEGVTVFAANGERYRGSYLINLASSHVYGKDTSETRRAGDTMEVRLDELVHCAADTADLGIQVGDFVAFDTRTEVINDFVRSRYLDDKACVACLVEAVHALAKAGLKPAQKTYLLISNYEEVGHGAAAGLPADVTELLAVDMAAVGEGQTSDEFNATLCVKDSGGPYHHEMSNRMRQIAEEYGIGYKVDIYPYYGSDGEAYWRAGGDVAVALIGPGVDASHNYERTHLQALIATTEWSLAYMLE